MGCRVWGAEYVPNRAFLAAKNMLDALADGEKLGALVNPKIAYVPTDLYLLTSLGDTTHAYWFDEAFPLHLIQHNARLASNTKTVVRVIISYKVSKHSEAHAIFEAFGFEQKASVTTPHTTTTTTRIHNQNLFVLEIKHLPNNG